MANSYAEAQRNRPTRARIDLAAFKHNIGVIRSSVGAGAKICVPVKADGYGHGAIQCARAALEAGAAFLGVATVGEGAGLRDADVDAPVLLFGPPLEDEISDLVKANLTPFLFDTDRIQAVGAAAVRQGKTITVHLKVDTGMGRVGCTPEEAVAMARLITQTPGLRLGGIATHLATSDSLGDLDREYTDEQFRCFTASIDAVRAAGIDPGIRHCANSGAVFLHPEYALDMLRPGIAVYGYFDGAATALRPVMTLVSRISYIKTVPPGTSVSYGRRWTAERPTRIATVPVGYGDGFTRRLNRTGILVGVGGAACPVVGSICMDQCMVDVSNAPEARVGDEVVLFGDKSRGAIWDATDIAKKTNTISYEILTSITKRVPRDYV
jgi:alanine racemase